jgi:signal transduction histidine kinase
MSTRHKARAAFASALILLVLSGVAAYVTLSHLLDSERWVIHSYKVQAALGDVESAMARAGRARAAFVYVDHEGSSAEFETAAAKVPERIQVLRNLIRDNPDQVKLCKQLQDAMDARIAFFRDSIRWGSAAPGYIQRQAEITKQSTLFAQQANSIMQQMRQSEQTLLKARVRTSDRLSIRAVVILAATFILALVLFAIHYRLLNNELLARAQAQQAARDSEESLRRLTVRLLRLQDEERRKLSRELHDSLAQYLAGVKMQLEMLSRSDPIDGRLQEVIHLVDESISETRTISHLLHPPLLDETGFASAAKWYLEGFARRSGMEVAIDVPGDMGRLPEAVELALFRVLQESITNVHRHAKSSKAGVTLKLLPGRVVLRIRDYGKGIPPDLLRSLSTNGTRFGVGVAGMRERIHELGGQFDVQSGASGTLVSVTLPYSQRPQPASTSAAD